MTQNSPDNTRSTVEEGDPLYLGTYTKFVSAYSIRNRARRWVEQLETGEARQVRYALLAFLRSRLPESFRTKRCLAQVQYGRDDVDLLYSEKHHSHFHGAAVCGSVWTCPICAERITAIRRTELKRLLVQTRYRVIMLTFTLEHHQGEPLEPMVNDLNSAIRAMQMHRAWRRFAKKWGIAGMVSALEVTFSRENYWHPHKHFMVLLDPEIIGKGPAVKARLETEMQLELFGMYHQALLKAGRDCDQEHGVDIRANRKDFGDYIAKWGAAEELTRSVQKQASGGGKSPWELLKDAVYGDLGAWDLFREYITAFKGKKQLHWSKGTRELLGLGEELTDEQAAETVQLADDRVVLLLARSAWHYLIYQDLLGPTLKYSDIVGGDPDQVRDYLARMGLRRGVVIPEPAADIWEGKPDV